MVMKYRIYILLASFAWSTLAVAGFQGGVQLKTTHHDNFNLANGEAVPVSETVNSTQVSLTWFKASSKEFVWLVNGYYSYNEYDKYAHLSGASVSLLGGMFYRFNDSNSMTLKLGKRERTYDDEELSLYQDDAHFAIMHLSHRLSPSTLLNEKARYEENEPHIESNKFHSVSGQVWFEWKVARGTKLSSGYIHTTRTYENRGTEFTFEEPYISLSYSLTRNVYTRIGYSKLKMTDEKNDRAYNKTAYLAIGFGF